jgi:hypothetical protein
MDAKNGRVGVGIMDPKNPLSFPALLGKKISLYPGGTGDAGIGVYANELRMYADNSNANITFGYDDYGLGYKERLRLNNYGQLLLGTNVSDYQVHFRGDNQRMMVLDNAASHDVGTENNILFKTNGRFDAFIGTKSTGTSSARLGFWTYSSPNENGVIERMSITDDGDVLIGTTDEAAGAGYKLRVNGRIIATELRVQTNGSWPDYVFEPNYRLMPLSDLKMFIDKEKHLPNIPSAQQVSDAGGIDVGDMQKRLTEKVEELTLYIIDLQTQINELKQIK